MWTTATKHTLRIALATMSLLLLAGGVQAWTETNWDVDYRAVDNDEITDPFAPLYDWEDLTTRTGVASYTIKDDSSGNNFDCNSSPVGIPFTFPFGGAEWTSFRINHNGYIYFGPLPPNCAEGGRDLDSSNGDPYYRIAGYYDDFAGTTVKVWTGGSPSRVVIEFRDLVAEGGNNIFCPDMGGSFQIKLFEELAGFEGVAEVHYDRATPHQEIHAQCDPSTVHLDAEAGLKIGTGPSDLEVMIYNAEAHPTSTALSKKAVRYIPMPPPWIVEDVYVGIEDAPIAVSLNVSDPSQMGVTLHLDDAPMHGRLYDGATELSAGGTFTNEDLRYEPNGDFFGLDSINVSASNPAGKSFGTVLTLDVLPKNDRPTTLPDTDPIVVIHDLGRVNLPWATPAVLGPPNEGDQRVRMAIVRNDRPDLFVMSPFFFHETGRLAFEAAPGMAGVANLQLQVQDTGGVTNGGVDTFIHDFTIEITDEGNQPPVALGGLRQVARQKTSMLETTVLSAHDDFTPLDRMKFRLETAPTAGTLRVSGTPIHAGDSFDAKDVLLLRVTYKHLDVARNSDAFTVTVLDGMDARSAPAQVQISIVAADAFTAPDADGDGVSDLADPCPGKMDPDPATETDGCGASGAAAPEDRVTPPATTAPDADADGVPDLSDNCATIANTGQTDTDLDGLGDVCDTDPDDDGLIEEDNCPLHANPSQGDLDGDSVGDACDPQPGHAGDREPPAPCLGVGCDIEPTSAGATLPGGGIALAVAALAAVGLATGLVLWVRRMPTGPAHGKD